MLFFNPMNDNVLSSALGLYEKVAAHFLPLVLLITTIRVVILLGTLGEASRYGEVFKDLIKYFGISALFPELIKVAFSVMGSIRIPFEGNEAIRTSMLEFSTKYLNNSFLTVFSQISDVAILAIANAIYSIFLGIILSVAPVIFILGLLFGVSARVSDYIQMLFAVMLWPVLWNLIGLLSTTIYRNSEMSIFGNVGFGFSIYLLQLLSPIFSYFLFRSVSPDAIGKAVGLSSKTISKVNFIKKQEKKQYRPIVNLIEVGDS